MELNDFFNPAHIDLTKGLEERHFLAQINNKYINSKNLIFGNTKSENSLSSLQTYRKIRNINRKNYLRRLKNKLDQPESISQILKQKIVEMNEINNFRKNASLKNIVSKKKETDIKLNLPLLKIRDSLRKCNLIKAQEILERQTTRTNLMLFPKRTSIKKIPTSKVYQPILTTKDIIDMTLEISHLWKKLVIKSPDKKNLETKEERDLMIRRKIKFHSKENTLANLEEFKSNISKIMENILKTN